MTDSGLVPKKTVEAMRSRRQGLYAVDERRRESFESDERELSVMRSHIDDRSGTRTKRHILVLDRRGCSEQQSPSVPGSSEQANELLGLAEVLVSHDVDDSVCQGVEDRGVKSRV